MPVSVVVLVFEVADHLGFEQTGPVVAVANVTLKGSAGSLVDGSALRGLCLFCGQSTLGGPADLA
jgi:hypothetical protein